MLCLSSGSCSAQAAQTGDEHVAQTVAERIEAEHDKHDRLQTMIISNEHHYAYLVQTASMLLEYSDAL